MHRHGCFKTVEWKVINKGNSHLCSWVHVHVRVHQSSMVLLKDVDTARAYGSVDATDAQQKSYSRRHVEHTC